MAKAAPITLVAIKIDFKTELVFSVLDPFGAEVVQENPNAPYVGEGVLPISIGEEEGEESGLAEDDPMVGSAPLGLGALVANENPDVGVGALVEPLVPTGTLVEPLVPTVGLVVLVPMHLSD